MNRIFFLCRITKKVVCYSIITAFVLLKLKGRNENALTKQINIESIIRGFRIVKQEERNKNTNKL